MHRHGMGALRSTLSSQGDPSLALLLELMTQEPTVLNCLRVVNSTCLAQGIRCKIKGQAVTNAFQKFLNLHYLPFCENAIRCMFTCGFVPWRIRRLCHGDSTPEVLPLGTFAWAVQSSHSRSVQRGTALACKRPAKVPRGPTGGSPHSVFDRQQRALSRQPLPQNDNDSRALRYVVHLTEPLGFESDDVEIYETVQPTHNVSQSSVLLPTITSPMAHIIVDYLILRQAQGRHSHADAWNTEAKIVCSYAAQKNAYTVNEGNPIVNDQWIAPQNRLGLLNDTNLPTDMELNVLARDGITESLLSAKDLSHRPAVLSLPKNTSLEGLDRLQPVQVISDLQQRLAKNITSLLGVPYELVSGGYSSQQATSKSLENIKVFTTSMMVVCQHLQNLLQQAYVSIYGGSVEDVEFVLRPTPRINVETVNDLVQLMQTGILSRVDAADVSSMLMGLDFQQSLGRGMKPAASAQDRFLTPEQESQGIMARASLQSSVARGKAQKTLH